VAQRIADLGQATVGVTEGGGVVQRVGDGGELAVVRCVGKARGDGVGGAGQLRQAQHSAQCRKRISRPNS